MTSNSYILWDNESRRSIVVDPGSERSLNEIEFIKESKLKLDYIILTHEHTDHNWGVNSLLRAFPETKVVCHKICAERITENSSKYFLLYNDDTSYSYAVDKVDITFEDVTFTLDWNGIEILLEYTPGHSMGSVCIVIQNLMFTGDTIMPYKPYINKRDGLKELYDKSISIIHEKYANSGMLICPGHGDLYIYE